MKTPFSKEITVKAHRAMWNWIADTIENERRIPSKSEFKYSDFYDTSNCIFNCYLCEYAEQQLKEYGKKSYPIYRIESRCQYCPMQWPNLHRTDKKSVTCCVTYTQHTGLYDRYETATTTPAKLKKAAKLARQIAELPEKTIE